MSFIAFGHCQLIKQLFHVLIEVPLKFIDHFWVVVLLNVKLDELSFILLRSFAGLSFSLLVVILNICLNVLIETDENARVTEASQSDLNYRLYQFLVRQQTLF